MKKLKESLDAACHKLGEKYNLEQVGGGVDDYSWITFVNENGVPRQEFVYIIYINRAPDKRGYKDNSKIIFLISQ